MTTARAIRISINALGGQGGGVLADWIIRAGEKSGFIAQGTSVPGVAQRTGATVYYIELFPAAAAMASGKAPVLALMPAPGDVDLLIASELMEAGRALARGLVTARTTLIASTHRVLAIAEKTAMGDGRRDAAPVAEAVLKAAGRAILFDMETAAQESGAPISAVLFGAVCGAKALPIERRLFEETIREDGRAADRNLAAFARGAALAEAAAPAPKVAEAPRESPDARVSAFPPKAHFFIREGYKRVVDHQDEDYGRFYRERLERVRDLDARTGGEARDWRLLNETARQLALLMAYQDAIRVADLKTRASRFERFRRDVRAADGQIVHVVEYLHPRPEEICDLLPPPLARRILSSRILYLALKSALGEGRRVSTTKLRGFLPLFLLSRLKGIRRASHRYRIEQARIDSWLSLIDAAADDYDFACALAGLPRLIKGYGDTHARGVRNYEAIRAALGAVRATADPARTLAALCDAALADEDAKTLDKALAALTAPPQRARLPQEENA